MNTDHPIPAEASCGPAEAADDVKWAMRFFNEDSYFHQCQTMEAVKHGRTLARRVEELEGKFQECGNTFFDYETQLSVVRNQLASAEKVIACIELGRYHAARNRAREYREQFPVTREPDSKGEANG